MAAFRRYLLAGIVVWLPLLVTYWVIRFLVDLSDKLLAVLPAAYQPMAVFGTHVPGLSIVATCLLLLFTGMLASNILGKRLLNVWEKLLSRIPLIRTIYSAVKQIVDALTRSGTQSFRQVVLVEYPREGVWSIAFQTSDQLINDQGEELLTVFIPTTPNPTSGFLIVVPKEAVTVLNISVEEAMKMVVSLGVVIPDRLTIH